MQNTYCPYDPYLPRMLDFSDKQRIPVAIRLASNTDLGAEERARLEQLIKARIDLTNNGLARQHAIAEAKAEATDDTATMKKSWLLRVWTTLSTFGRINRDNWDEAVDFAGKACEQDEIARINGDYGKSGSQLSQRYNQLERETHAYGQQHFSPAAMGIWNALGGRQEMYPRFVIPVTAAPSAASPL